MWHILDPETQEIVGSFGTELEAKHYCKEWEIIDRRLYTVDFDDVPDYDLE